MSEFSDRLRREQRERQHREKLERERQRQEQHERHRAAQAAAEAERRERYKQEKAEKQERERRERDFRDQQEEQRRHNARMERLAEEALEEERRRAREESLRGYFSDSESEEGYSWEELHDRQQEETEAGSKQNSEFEAAYRDFDRAKSEFLDALKASARADAHYWFTEKHFKRRFAIIGNALFYYIIFKSFQQDYHLMVMVGLVVIAMIEIGSRQAMHEAEKVRLKAREKETDATKNFDAHFKPKEEEFKQQEEEEQERQERKESDRDRAYSILGLRPGASQADIRAAYLRLIRRAHPDAGGDNEKAKQLNSAYELLRAA